MKQTTDSKHPWCHVLCAKMLPGEATFLNPAYLEPISISRIDPERWGLVCQGCRRREGAPAQCSAKSCHVALHAKCARALGCDMDVEEGSLRCLRHSEMHLEEGDKTRELSDFKESNSRGGVINIEAAESNLRSLESKSNMFRNPIASRLTLDSILAETSACKEMQEKQREALFDLVSRYWSLKRSLRRGIPLIRSLQIEPWTSGGLLKDVQASLESRGHLHRYLTALEKVTSHVLQREKRKRAQFLTMEEILRIVQRPFRTVLSIMCASMERFDENRLFFDAVNELYVPDYYSIIKRPMHISMIASKVASDVYTTLDEFAADFELIHSNAILYNTPGTVYYDTAVEFILKFRQLAKVAKASLARLASTTDEKGIWIRGVELLQEANMQLCTSFPQDREEAMANSDFSICSSPLAESPFHAGSETLQGTAKNESPSAPLRNSLGSCKSICEKNQGEGGTVVSLQMDHFEEELLLYRGSLLRPQNVKVQGPAENSNCSLNDTGKRRDGGERDEIFSREENDRSLKLSHRSSTRPRSVRRAAPGDAIVWANIEEGLYFPARVVSFQQVPRERVRRFTQAQLRAVDGNSSLIVRLFSEANEYFIVESDRIFPLGWCLEDDLRENAHIRSSLIEREQSMQRSGARSYRRRAAIESAYEEALMYRDRHQ